MTWGDYLRNIGTALRTLLWAWSALWNVIYLGEVDESFSTRVGWSIKTGGFWSRVWLPKWLKAHFDKSRKWNARWE